MRYIFENENSNKEVLKETDYSKYFRWMYSVLKRSEEIGKVELPISS